MPKQTVNRCEYKYLVDEVSAVSLRSKLGRLLERDPYSRDGSYRVRSLYFDTPSNKSLYSKLDGVEVRQKVRLRMYPPHADACKLEVKRKWGDRQRKISLTITGEDAARLIAGDLSVILDYADEAEEAAEIYTEMELGLMRPVVMIEYLRDAFIHPVSRTRVTVDRCVMCSESDLDFFSEQPLYSPSVLTSSVLEVKYSGAPLRFITDILKPYKLTRTAVSKYCQSRPLAYEFS